MKRAEAAAPRVLFLSRAFPPLVGGLERQNYELARSLARFLPVTTFANRRGKKLLPLFMLSGLCRGLRRKTKFDLVLLGDAVLAPLGAILRRWTGIPVAAVAHGLDVTYPRAFYQRFWLSRGLSRLDAVIAVSRTTRQECLRRGVHPQRIYVIPNGVTLAADACASARLGWLLEEKRRGRKILLSVGRLRKRKGVAWFVQEVMPRLPSECLFVVAGEGPERSRIQHICRRGDLSRRVRLAGKVTEKEKAFLLAQAHLFIQPNIPVPGDIEGFGIGALEAAAGGLPVIAADLDGLRDAIRNGKNGIRVPPLSAEEFATQILRLLDDEEARLRLGRTARGYTLQRYGWDGIARRYEGVLRRVWRSARLAR